MNISVLFVIAADGTTPEPFPMATTETTSFIPWIIVHAYQHTYLVGS